MGSHSDSIQHISRDRSFRAVLDGRFPFLYWMRDRNGAGQTAIWPSGLTLN